MQRRKFLSLFGIGGMVAAAPVAAATVAIVKAGREEYDAFLPALPPKKPDNNPYRLIQPNMEFNSITFNGKESSMIVGVDKREEKDNPILSFSVNDVKMNSQKFVEIEPGKFVMYFEKEKVNESKKSQSFA